MAIDKQLLFLLGTGVCAYQMVTYFIAALDRTIKIGIETSGLYISGLKENFMIWEEISAVRISRSSNMQVSGSIKLKNGDSFYFSYYPLDADAKRIYETINSQIDYHSSDKSIAPDLNPENKRRTEYINDQLLP